MIGNQRGFTLIEILIVVGILGTVALFAIPTYLDQLPNIRLNSAVRDLKSNLELARIRAIRENADVVIWFESSRYRAFLDDGAGAGGAGDGFQSGAEKTLFEKGWPRDVELFNRVFSVKVNQTNFNGKGLPEGGWGWVRLKNTKEHYRGIVVSIVGHIQIQQSTDGGTSWHDIS